MNPEIRLGISACLLGRNVRYDGGHKLDHFLVDTLGRFVDWVPVCPEVECGLPVPREAMRLVGDPEAPRLVVIESGVDYTERLLRWSEQRLEELQQEGLSGFIFKARSPSCGLGVVPEDTGSGLFARAFVRRYSTLPVEDEDRLTDPLILRNFMERVKALNP